MYTVCINVIYFPFSVQVTGRLLSTPELSDIGDILAFPDLTTSARNPRFSYRLVVNQNQVNLDKNMLLLLKVYTVDAVDQKLTVIGSCAFDIFNKTTVSYQYTYAYILRPHIFDNVVSRYF